MLPVSPKRRRRHDIADAQALIAGAATRTDEIGVTICIAVNDEAFPATGAK